MTKKQVMVNICGVPESEWVDGYCTCGRSRCDMSDAELIEKRAFDYGQKHFGLSYGSFDAEQLRNRLDGSSKVFKLPKYFREAISCDGQTFSQLEDFPLGTSLRVCRDSKDGTLTVGMICWRSKSEDCAPERLCVYKSDIVLDADVCKKCFVGAMFEPTWGSINYQ